MLISRAINCLEKNPYVRHGKSHFELFIMGVQETIKKCSISIWFLKELEGQTLLMKTTHKSDIKLRGTDLNFTRKTLRTTSYIIKKFYTSYQHSKATLVLSSY